jgi:hypothetical protein
MDTAHNTALSLAVEGGAVAVLLGTIIALSGLRDVLRMRGGLRIASGTALLVLCVASLTATVERSRSTWFLLAVISLSGRLSIEEPDRVAQFLAARNPRLSAADGAPIQSEG